MSNAIKQYDYIIVGAGSSGSVLADRLSADGKSQVLLIEAGGRNESELVRMPRGFIKMWGADRYFWTFPVEAQVGRPEGESWMYGKGLGGSSSVNGTWYLRGMPADYNSWGMDEWRWPEIERCFKSIEDYRYSDADPSRGKGGPLQITRNTYESPVIDATLAAAEQLGLPVLGDINTPNTDGIGHTQVTVDRFGRRASTYSAFLKPAMRRPNLTVLTDAIVERVLIDKGEATGVRCRRKGRAEEYHVRREVILSAGVLQSPKLLQLSGIGPAAVLEQAGVPVVLDVPAVGRNLAEHAMFSISYRLKNNLGINREFSGWRLWLNVLRYYLTRKGLMSFTSVNLTSLIAMRSPKTWPDVQIGIIPFSMRSSAEAKADPGRGLLEDKPGLTFNGFYLRPKSRGTVAIRSSDVDQPMSIHANWWGDSEDKEIAVEMIRLTRRFAAQPALKKFVGEEITPGARYRSDAEIASALEWLISPGLHGTGTCRMGPKGNDAVLDSRLRVHGIRRLRVVDCSSIPTSMSGNTNGPAIVLAARGAELILEDRDRAAVS